jgi:hypothetical protein
VPKKRQRRFEWSALGWLVCAGNLRHTRMVCACSDNFYW